MDATDRASSERSPGRGGLACASGIALVAWFVRMLPVPSVFIDGQTYFTDSDSYYHLRRIVYDLAAFPGTLDYDAYLNFPVGAKAIWPQTFDWLLALLLVPFGFAEDPAGLEEVLVFLPPILGAATVFALHRIVVRSFDARVANGAALILALLPAHYWYSQVGFLDHHVAVSLCATLLLGASLASITRCEAADVAGGRAIGLGLLLASNLMIWPGSVLYVVLTLGSLLLLATLSHCSRTRMAALVTVTRSSAIACLALAPMCIGNDWPQWGHYSPVVLSRFQPWLLLAIALHAGLSWAAFRRGFDRSLGIRIAWMVGCGAMVLIASVLGLPGLDDSVRDASQWLGKRDAFQGLVGESVPLFVLHGAWTTQIATSRLSYFVFVFPFAVMGLAWIWREDPRRSERFVLLLWAVVLFGFTLLQKRFFNTFAVAMAFVMALALVEAGARWLPVQTFGSRGKRAVIVAAAIVLLAPSLAVYLGPLGTILSRVRAEAPVTNHRVEVNRARRELTDWLREYTPETSGFLDAGVQPEYGVLARWGEGHFITSHARRPAVIGNFGDDLGRDHFLLARSFFTADPDRASQILETLRVRYVVIRSMAESRALAQTLFRRDGSRLGRFRLVHEVRPMAGVDVPAYKVFEFVKGAELLGQAPPRAIVRAELDLVTNLGRVARYEVVAQTDPQGRYRLQLAHPTVDMPGGIDVASHYRIRVAEVEKTLDVPDAAVQQGAVLRGPSF